MTEKTAIAIRHVMFEDLNGFTPALQAAGYRIRYLDIGDPTFCRNPDPADPDLLIILGGPIGAYEDIRYPFLKDELRLIEARLSTGRPLMGICLGAQLIARAAGANVFPTGTKEIGFAPITLTEAGAASCLRPFSRSPITLHWHGDTFDLPSGAVRLASTALCDNQAYSLGPSTIGFQFHPEATGAAIEAWLVGHAVELATADIDVATIRADAQRLAGELADKARAVAADWLAALPES